MIYLSHSDRDLEQVRQISNEVERRAHTGCASSIKCLEADDAHPAELIREEIPGLASVG